MQRRLWLALPVTFAVAVAACAQVVGLGGYQKVECLDDCADVANVEPAVDASPEAQPPSDCAGTSTRCGGACVELSTDVNNCGTCGTACGTASCCKGACADTTTSPTSCGACGVTCLGTESCAAGACRLLALGNGADGPLAITTDTIIDGVLTGGLAIAAGTRVASVASTVGFAAGDLVLVHQTRGPAAGTYELGTIEKVDTASTTITMARAVTHGFTSTGKARAQMVRVPQHTTVFVAPGVTLTAPPWDGTRGGILVFEAGGAVQVAGAINMTGRGFQGYNHGPACAGGARYVCTTADTANGFAGESADGPALVSNAPNGGGGGGSQDGQDCGGGGGGGHGTAGTAGSNGAGGVCRAAPQLGGAAGMVAGVDDLSVALLFGGAGGEGSGDEDGAYPGAGGNGGGIISIRAQTVTVAGGLKANGSPGASGVQVSAACGGSGCGMGAGGGGAGGAISIRVTAVSLGANLVSATGDIGGACTCGGMPGGSGGSGRIAVTGTVSGTTTPAYVGK